MALTYNTFVTSLANMIVVPVNDPNYVAALPNIIDDAELRLYRELDLLNTVVVDSTAQLVGRLNTEPTTASGPFVVTQSISVFTPVGVPTDASVRHPLLPVSKEVIDTLYPGTAGFGVPIYFAMVTQNTFVVGPFPDAGYHFEITGTVRPLPLSASNQTTLLSTYFPDILLAASLVMSAGYQLNFSAMGDNPQAGVTWETHVKTLLTPAIVEEMRKKFGSEGWTSRAPDPIATPPRT